MMAAGVQEGTSLVGSEGPGAPTLVTQGNAEAGSAACCGAKAGAPAVAGAAAGASMGPAEPTCRACQSFGGALQPAKPSCAHIL